MDKFPVTPRVVIVFLIVVCVLGVVAMCNDPDISEKDWQKVKNTIERLDKDMDKLKARKCACKK